MSIIKRTIATALSLTLISSVVASNYSFAQTNTINLDDSNRTSIVNVLNSTIPNIELKGYSVTNLVKSTGYTMNTPNTDEYDTFKMESGKYYVVAGKINLMNTADNARIRVDYDSNGTNYFFGETVYAGTTGYSAIAFSANVTDPFAKLTTQSTTSNDSNDKVFSELRVYEVSYDEYSDLTGQSSEYINSKMPYMSGSQELADIVVDVRGTNLAPDYDEWLTSREGTNIKKQADGSYLIEKLNSSAVAKKYVFTLIPVEKNTEYSVSAKFKDYVEIGQQPYIQVHPVSNLENDFLGDSLLSVTKKASASEFASLSGTFNSGDNSEVYMVTRIGTSSESGYNTYAKEPMLVKGTVLPTEYVEPSISQVFIDSKLSDYDTLTIIDGKAVVENGQLSMEIDGALPFEHYWGGTPGVEIVRAKFDINAVDASGVVTKYDGENLDYHPPGTHLDYADKQSVNEGYVYISIDIEDAGWGENYQPSPAEIKAYFNGWVTSGSDGQLYDETSSTQYWYRRYQGIGTPSYTGVKFDSVVEFGSSQTTLPTDKAYGNITKGYSLRYSAVEKENNTLETLNMLKLLEGEVHITVSSGIRMERVNPVLDSGTYFINDQISDLRRPSAFSKTAKRILRVVKSINGEMLVDNENWNLNRTDGNPYGEVRASILASDYDPSVDYYVVYETIKAENTSDEYSLTLTYADSVGGVLDTLVKKNEAQDTEIYLLKELIKNLVENGSDKNIKFEYDEQGNLKEIISE